MQVLDDDEISPYLFLCSCVHRHHHRCHLIVVADVVVVVVVDVDGCI